MPEILNLVYDSLCLTDMTLQDLDKKEEKWYFDSGCTSHMTGNKDLL